MGGGGDVISWKADRVWFGGRERREREKERRGGGEAVFVFNSVWAG